MARRHRKVGNNDIDGALAEYLWRVKHGDNWMAFLNATRNVRYIAKPRPIKFVPDTTPIEYDPLDPYTSYNPLNIPGQSGGLLLTSDSDIELQVDSSQ